MDSRFYVLVWVVLVVSILRVLFGFSGFGLAFARYCCCLLFVGLLLDFEFPGVAVFVGLGETFDVLIVCFFRI